MALDATAVSLLVVGVLIGAGALAGRLAGGAVAAVPGALRDTAVVAARSRLGDSPTRPLPPDPADRPHPAE